MSPVYEGSCEVFVKIGGSILDQEPLTATLVPHLVALAGRHRIVILTGGGQRVKRIKANQRRAGTSFYDCWKAGVDCIEVNAHLLASYSTSFKIVSCLADLGACFEADGIAVFAPAGAIVNSLELVPDWQVTTDSMGLYFAHRLRARRYVIVSDVHGIYEHPPEQDTSSPPLAHLKIEQLERLPASKLDPVFPTYFRRYPLATVVVNGKHPNRVSAAILGEPTVGTSIVPPAGRLA
jgi:aspartokinase-like uncharacterized kinase